MEILRVAFLWLSLWGCVSARNLGGSGNVDVTDELEDVGGVWQNELEENEGLIEGDIIPSRHRSGIRDPNARWSNGVVPYTISRRFFRKDKQLIRDAMSDLENKVRVGSKDCIKFAPWGKESGKDVIKIEKGAGCSSSIGRQHGAQVVNLAAGSWMTSCMSPGIIQHELMHALGFYHEQSRYDRDDFITINWENIIDGHEHNFRKVGKEEMDLQGQTYDYGSLMHYGNKEFGKGGSKGRAITITPKKEGVRVGQRNGPSPEDVKKIQLLYKCI